MAIPLLMLAVVAYLGYKNTQRANSAREWLAHTGAVLAALHDVQSDLWQFRLDDMKERVEGGPAQLTPGLPMRLDSDLLNLRSLTRDNAEQRQNLDRFEHLYRQLLQESLPKPGEHKISSTPLYAVDAEAWKDLSILRENERHLMAARLELIGVSQQRNEYFIQFLMASSTALLCLAFWMFYRKLHMQDREKKASRVLIEELRSRSSEAALQNSFSQALQLCTSVNDVYEVIAGFIESLFPGLPGAIAYVNNSRNLVVVSRKWNGGISMPETFSPDSCCAYRLGHEYQYPHEPYTLPCRHFEGEYPYSTYCMPLVAHGETIGLIHLQGNVAGTAQLASMSLISGHAAMAIVNLRMRDQLRSQSLQDPLTGLFNRRYLDSILLREVERAKRKRQSFGVLMIDIDHFKRINDRFGHDIGDRVIKRVAETMRDHFRETDVTCRFGGEEFAVLLIDTELRGAITRANSLREKISQILWPFMSEERVTISSGLSLYPEHGDTPEELLHAADKALYQAKGGGRNRLTLAISADSVALHSTAITPNRL